MKRSFLLILICSTLFASRAYSQDTLRVLAIGNSFSQDCVEQYLYELSASDGGPELIIGNLYIGGCTIQRHWKSISQKIRDYQYRKIVGGVLTNTRGKLLIEGLSDEKWDVISFQHGAGLYGLYDTFFPEVDSLVAYIRANAPKKDFQLLFNEVWSFPEGTSRVNFMEKYYNNDTEQMYRSIVDASERIAEHVGVCKVVPVGTAIWNLRHTWDRDNCYRDGFHLNNASGRYTAACTWYEALTGRSSVGNAYHPDFITAERALVCQSAAHAAVSNPTQLTDIGFRKSPVNYDESKVPAYTLPDALVMNDGSKVRNARQWTSKRRGEILELFEREVYGKAPGRPEAMTFKTLYTAEGALGGIATRREVRVYFSADKKHYMTLLIYAPAGKKASPAFLGINFKGNESICDDPGITLPDKAQLKGYGIHPLLPRGYSASSWPVEEIVRRGYALVTFCRDDVDPDTDDAFKGGVHPLFFRKSQRLPDPDQWGTIAAWAWGLSRAMDYLETDEMIDAKRVAAIGHSRLGKTALWAAALDTRFAMSISNCSGCGGAALSRRAVGETVAAINRNFPHWFCRNFQKYNDNEAALPVDQHELIALIAPRPVYVASASEDKWADPVGEGLAAAEAAKVYELFHATDRIGRHIHEGRHSISIVDWNYYLDFADKWLGNPRGKARKAVGQTGKIAVVSHRGFWNSEAGGMSQNSIASLKAAQDNGFWGSECDIHLTADNQIIVNHDRDINGKKIRTTNFEELASCLLPNGERRPSFDEYLDQAAKSKTTRLVVEFKIQDSPETEDILVDKAIAAIKAHKLYKPDRVLFISFSKHVCDRIARIAPAFTNQYLEGDIAPASLAKDGINGIDYHKKVMMNNPDWTREAHKLGMSVNCWTASKTSDIQQMINLGVDAITTDEPLLARQLLGDRELH